MSGQRGKWLIFMKIKRWFDKYSYTANLYASVEITAGSLEYKPL